MKPKVILIGLDGATWTLLKPLAEAGILPTFSHFLSKGTNGNLLSTFPCYTGPAWTSMVTGVTPGKHGIFGFIRDHNVASINSTQVPKIWDILNKKGITTGIMNVPLTYPVKPVEGFMIPGMLTPMEDPAVWPSDVLQFIRRENGRYIIDVAVGHGDINDPTIFKRIEEALQLRFQAFSLLMRTYSPDFSMIVFEMPDRLQHLYWKYLDPLQPFYTTAQGVKIRNEIITLFKKLDTIIGEIYKRFYTGHYVLLASDHGFTSLEYCFYLDNYLVKKGFQKRKRGSYLYSILSEIESRARRYIGQISQAESFANFYDLSDIDWETTVAYASPMFEQGAYIRKDLVDKCLIIDRLRKELNSLEHPDKPDTKLKVDITLKEDAFGSGMFTDSSPDIFMNIEDSTFEIRQYSNKKILFLSKKHLPCGIHHPKGLFSIIGPAIRDGLWIEDIRITDIFPTILSIYGVPIPQLCDGKVITQSFLEGTIKPVYINEEPMVSFDRMKMPYTEDQTEEIRKKLSGLGYL